MKPIVFEDSPLALYLEGDGEAEEHEWIPNQAFTAQTTSPLQSPSFAPQGLPVRRRKLRSKPPRLLNLDRPRSEGAVARLHHACSSAINARLGWAENGRFLEQFRYTIIASQLLNDVANPGIYKRQTSPTNADNGLADLSQDGQTVPFSWSGLSVTAWTAFALAWSIQWVRDAASSPSSAWPLVLAPAFLITISTMLYLYFRRQRLHWIRNRAVDSASTLITSAQNVDAALSASVNLIQEVEVLNICGRSFPSQASSNPLPPVSRMDGKSQIRRCTRLRGAMQRVLISLPQSYYKAFEAMKSLAVEADLEKYYDIYEITRTEILEVEGAKDAESATPDGDTLRAFKVGLQKSHLARKLFLCTLLALSADGGKVDFAKWSTATRIMDAMSVENGRLTQDVDQIIGPEEDLPMPDTAQMPLTPGRERMRSRMRRLASLSKGLRGLQARMHLLCEDADKIAGNCFLTSSALALRYDSLGIELKGLLEEWQEGQAVFKPGTDAPRTSLSLPALPRTTPSSPTTSLGGSTVVEESPPGALRALDGYGKRQRSLSSTATSSAGEEVFEAVALPRQKSTWSREERIARMKEDRVLQAVMKGKAEASTHMLKELETVIKLRPRGRTTGRVTPQ